MIFSTNSTVAKGVLWLVVSLLGSGAHGAEQPNILVIFGDDIGMYNISAYHQGMMGGSTPNIDRIANEGVRFTDYYAEQSCTAGRAAFITGQHPLRTGLLKVGFPGSNLGIRSEDPTLAKLLQAKGYTTGQFGKNHLGDLDEFLPTQHGFDEFYGNLYHLNAEEEPETDLYPKDAEFHKRYGPRGVIHSYADGGANRIEDTGPLTRKRMETIDEEFLSAAKTFIKKAHDQKKPFFTWFNATRMHVWTRLNEKWRGKTGYGLYADGMAEHDYHVGQLLDQLDELGIADNTIVIYSTDNGAQTFTFPDAGTIPFRGTKGTTWEGGFRVPALVRWPGKIKPGGIINDMFSHQDWLPTLLAVVGESEIKEKLKLGYRAGDNTYKVHLDGYNQLGLLQGKEAGRRETFFYFDDDSNLNAVRWKDWKIHFATKDDWFYGQRQVFTIPKVVNLRMDPFERSLDADTYVRWAVDQLWIFMPVRDIVAEFFKTFKEFPPRQKSLALKPDDAVQALQRMAAP